MRVLISPRLWLLIWLGIGAAGLLYVILSAALSGQTENSRHAAAEAAVLGDPNLLTGDMANFVYAASARGAPGEAFLHDGREMTLADFRGRTILVNFWATWCAPCLKELPSLDALDGALGGPDFAVVAVASDARGAETAREYLDKLKLRRLDLYADPKLALLIATGGSAQIPVSILYDARGREVGRFVGPADWSSPEAKALMKAVIASTRR